MSTVTRTPNYAHVVPGDTAWRKGCRCPECHAAHRVQLDRDRARKNAHNHPPGLCPVHDVDDFDACTCGGSL